jgi:hypothetical protein
MLLGCVSCLPRLQPGPYGTSPGGEEKGCQEEPGADQYNRGPRSYVDVEGEIEPRH